MSDLGARWLHLRDELLELAEGECNDIRADIFDVVATQLALGADAVDNRGLRIAVYRHIEQGTTDAQLLELCDRFFAAGRIALPRSLKAAPEREAVLDAVTRVCRETVTVAMLAAVERALQMRDVLLAGASDPPPTE
ncbi:MAG: hypothetical protein IPL79_09980 [Myxococcales bacterium]|nr:hypothetical protein [Myxococcales bacterium]